MTGINVDGVHETEVVEELGRELLEDPAQQTLEAIHGVKGELLFLRRAARPVREIVGSLQRGDSALVSRETRPNLRDLYDHGVRVVDAAETYRDLVGGMVDRYMSAVSNRMNEITKVLTIIATIFIP